MLLTHHSRLDHTVVGRCSMEEFPYYGGSGRQQMITLSTAESELLAIIDGAVATKGMEAMLSDLGEEIEEKHIASDSTAALSISSGSSSWRTRHLKIKANWLNEQLEYGMFKATRCPGERQLADLLTKALTNARTSLLLGLWGVRDRGQGTTSTTTTAQASAKMMVASICCLLMISVQAREGEETGQERPPGLQVDWDNAGLFMILLMVLGALMLWEGLKWVIVEAYQEWTPGASSRKIKRLQKLQDATTVAIERELQRLQDQNTRSIHGLPDSENGTTASATSTLVILFGQQ